MKEKWNEKYSTDEYFFGKEPNDFFKEAIDSIAPGKALFLGEGEGRNSVYAATLGWEVDALDISEVGKQKANRLAQENNTKINYLVADALEYNYPLETYDAIVMVYFHIQDDLRENFRKNIIASLKPHGIIILLLYDEDHLKNNNGGPQDISFLYTLESVAESYIDLEFQTFAKEEIVRTKKNKHQKSSIIKFIGKKVF